MKQLTDTALIEQLKARVRTLDEQIETLSKQRSAAIEMISTLNGEALKAPRLRREKSPRTSRKQIIDAVIELIKKNQRPVNTEEILAHVKELGIKVGKTPARQRSFVGAVLSHEVRDENKDKALIVRVERGVYDMKK